MILHIKELRNNKMETIFRSLLLVHAIFVLSYCIEVKGENCSITVQGTEYTGAINMTRDNQPCQRWDVQLPHRHSQTQVKFNTLMDKPMNHNYCRNPDNEPNGPWCYTTNRNIRWQYCDIPKCVGSKNCTRTVLGKEYTGKRNWTETNLTCQRWDMQYPHKHSRGQEFFNTLTDKTVNHNYCRNPDSEPNGPWCYTTNPRVRWQYCDIQQCISITVVIDHDESKDCLKTITGKEYTGTKNKTKYNQNCQKWNVQFPHRHSQTQERFNTLLDKSMNNNYCRNPDNEPNGPWCYTTNRKFRWQYCDIPKCLGKDCLKTITGKEYTGTKNKTKYNQNCQKWNVQFPHRHSQTQERFNTLLDKSMNNNYCRNPDNEPNGPWCYTTNRKFRWQYCDIPKCLDKPNMPTVTEKDTDVESTVGIIPYNTSVTKSTALLESLHTETNTIPYMFSITKTSNSSSNSSDSLNTKTTTGTMIILTGKSVNTQSTIPYTFSSTKTSSSNSSDSIKTKTTTGNMIVSTGNSVASQSTLDKPLSSASSGDTDAALVVGLCVALGVVLIISVVGTIIWYKCFKSRKGLDSLQISLVYNAKS